MDANLKDLAVLSDVAVLHRNARREAEAFISLVAPSKAPVLLVGRNREDAEVYARLIHQRSTRGGAAFVRARCGLFQGRLLERQFFGRAAGHSRAHFRRVGPQPGHVEQANGGTLYVEQIQLATPAMQEGLLRILSGKTFFDPVSRASLDADVRIVAGVPSDIAGFVRSGRILAELAERLSVVTMEIPATLAGRVGAGSWAEASVPLPTYT